MAFWMHPRLVPRRPGRGTVARLLLLALLAGLACDEGSLVPPFCPPYRIGIVEGYVRSGGEGVAATVGVRRDASPWIFAFQTRSDSTGWYRLELPTDLYRIDVVPAPGVDYYPFQDTVRVTIGKQRFDILRGKLTVRVATPAALDGKSLWCNLDAAGGSARYTSTRVLVRDRRLEALFPWLSPGTYRVRLGSDLNPSFWLPGTYDIGAADRIVVPVDRPVVYEKALDRYASISGNIRGSWQQAYLSGPYVVAYTLDAQQISRTNATADGSFTLELFAATPVKLRVDFYGIEQWIGGDSLENATVFDPQPGEHLGGISLVEGGLLCRLEGPGFLTDHDAEILLRDEDGRAYRPSVYNRNPIPICNLRPGRYALHVYGYCDYGGEPWASQWYDGADSLAAATWIDLPEGQLVPITVHLVDGGAIEGRVLGGDGLPAPSAVVAVFDRNGASPCRDRWQNFGAGSFAFRGLGNGAYKLAAWTDAGSWWYPGTAVLDSARVIEIRDPAAVTGIEWRLPPARREVHP